MISIPRVVLFLVGAVLLLANTSVAQITPTPAGGVATNATPVPIWWRKYKKDLGAYFAMTRCSMPCLLHLLSPLTSFLRIIFAFRSSAQEMQVPSKESTKDR
jgi:hypothetical protein